MTCCVLLQSDTTEDDRRLSNTAVDILGHLAQDQRPESQQVFSRDSLGQAFSNATLCLLSSARVLVFTTCVCQQAQARSTERMSQNDFLTSAWLLCGCWYDCLTCIVPCKHHSNACFVCLPHYNSHADGSSKTQLVVTRWSVCDTMVRL